MNNTDDLIKAVDETAGTSFDASAEAFGENRIARRPSGSAVKGFYRPDERRQGGVPFDVTPTKCAAYEGKPFPERRRQPTTEEKNGVWRLESEYDVGRLGKNRVENSRLWDCALWFLRLHEIATKPASATRALSLITAPMSDEINATDVEDFESLDHELRPHTFETLYIMEMVKELDRIEQEQPAPPKSNRQRPVFDSRLEAVELRIDADKTLRMLKAGMRTLWNPVKLAVVDRIELNELGTSDGVGPSGAAAAGRQRVIEGLRIAASIRSEISRHERALEARYKDRCILDSIDWGTALAGLAVVGLPPKLLPANDNYRSADAAQRAA